MVDMFEQSLLSSDRDNNVKIPDPERLSLNLQTVPLYAVLLSGFHFLFFVATNSRPVQPLFEGLATNEVTADSILFSDSTKGYWQRRVAGIGGKAIFGIKICKLDAVLTLLILYAYSGYKVNWTWDAITGMVTLIYAVFLSTLNTFTGRKIASAASRHLTLIMLTLFLIYAYRDLWPLMTFTLRPLDDEEGGLLWVKIGLSALIGIALPLVEPFPYTYAQPETPTSPPNPEQTASIASFLFYTFLDSTIWRAYRLPHLSYDKLPLLCDYDDAKILKQKNYPYLDPFSGAKKGRLFFGLMRVFKHTLLRECAVLVFMAVAKISSPVAVNRLLNYLEQGPENSVVRPWVWIALIALGPISYSVLQQMYQFLSTAASVRIESIITSLVFDHALRTRMKADVPDIAPAAGDRVAAAEAPTDDAAPVAETGGTHEPEADNENLTGKLNNLVTSDLDNITAGRDFLLVVLSAPLEISLSIWFLYKVLGWSSIVGLVAMMIFFPLPTLGASFMDKTEERKMKTTDSRVQYVTELMTGLRMIKLFGWESQAKAEADKQRDEELNWIWRRRMLEIANGVLNYTIPMLHMVVTYTIYTTIMKKELNASVVFSSLGAFNILRDHLYQTFDTVPSVIRANVSLRRVADFLSNTELLDCFMEQPEDVEGPINVHRNDIGFGAAEFTWTQARSDSTVASSRQHFRLRIEDDLVFMKSGLNLIVGPTGSGKTSILMALLGEMHYISLQPNSWFNFPRTGGVAYAAQESWVQNETIKDNILFGSSYDEERYQKVLYQCALKPDLRLLDAGDATEVGEKGLTLSGGQKARITLARAVYSNADILLLDDVLSALDTHTARWIVRKCFKGDLLRDRTVLLVTHNTGLLGPIADFVVSLNGDGTINKAGTIADVLSKELKELTVSCEEDTEEIDVPEEGSKDFPEAAKDGKLIVAEEVEVGHIGKPALVLLFGALGGKWPILFWVQYAFSTIMSEILDALQFWWLGWWARQYTLHEPGDVSIAYYLGTYGLIVLILNLFHIYHSILYAGGTLHSSRTIHRKLMSALVGSTFRWLDVTPMSRVIARCTQDVQAVDGPVAQYLSWLVLLTMSMLAKLGAVLIYAPVFLLSATAVAAIGGYLGHIYMKAQLPVKREMSNAKAPVLGIFGGAIAGLISIRAYGAQQTFRDETAKRINRYVRCARTFWNLNRWISVRIDALSATFAASLAFYFVYGSSSPDPSSIGFILIMAVSFSEKILWWVRIFNDFEVTGNSLERIQQYLTIEQEPEPVAHGTPPAYWPASGDLRVEKLSARYSLDGPLILKDLTFHIQSGERVGVVGRTGAGKSSLTLSLLRCIYTEGAVYYDGVPTHTINLDALRSNITIIPQVPELLSGTLRQNLDMFGQYDDATLNDALRAAGLASLQSEENRVTLDTQIASGGSNFSVGQRQMIAIARAIVRRSKLLILDEATSAIDYETDAAIQASLRHELESGVTVLTVAHRLQTIMDSDRIMVLDEGRIVEFDSPMTLVRNEKSFLRGLVEESADKEALYAVMKGKV